MAHKSMSNKKKEVNDLPYSFKCRSTVGQSCLLWTKRQLSFGTLFQVKLLKVNVVGRFLCTQMYSQFNVFNFQLLILNLLLLKVNNLPIITNNEEEEARKHKHKVQRPCGKSGIPEGRKFFDWSFEFVDVNVNYNYNYNCGGGGGGATSSNSQVQGAGISSHFAQKPHGNLGLGLLGLLFGTGTGTSSSSSSSSSSSASASAGVASPPIRPPPVTEVPQDEVLPDRFGQLKPGSYVTASNPFFGSYTYNLNSNRVIKQIDKGVDWLLQPLWNLL